MPNYKIFYLTFTICLEVFLKAAMSNILLETHKLNKKTRVIMRPESTTYSSLPLTTSPLACTPKRNIGAHFVNLSSGLIKYPTLSAGQKM